MIPFNRPTLPPWEIVEAEIREAYESGIITNADYCRRFEARVAELLGVRHVIPSPNATVGLIMLLSTLPPGSEVIMPALTFSATLQAALWNGLKPVLVDCDECCNIDVTQVEGAITERTSAILAAHMYGTPARVAELEQIAGGYGLRLFFDAAHAFGSAWNGRYVGGGGTAEVFSLGPTKTLPVGEGGLITTDDDDFAFRVRLIANRGQPPGSVDSLIKSLNGRLEEINAIVGYHVLDELEFYLARRTHLAERYRALLGALPGISFPHVPPEARSTYKDFTIFVDPIDFGVDRTELAYRLGEQEIMTKRYFDPPLHRLGVTRATHGHLSFPRTDFFCARLLSLPFYGHMPEAEVEAVCEAVDEIHARATGRDTLARIA